MKKTAPQQPSSFLSELRSSDYLLLIGLTLVTVIEAILYSWVEVLLYTAAPKILYNTWIFGHYTIYHVVLGLLVLVMIFGVGFVSWLTYSPTRFRKFFLIALGDFVLWLMIEDEFTFIFSSAPHTLTDWTDWPFGTVSLLGHLVPTWYVLATMAVFALWTVGLSVDEMGSSLLKRNWTKKLSRQ